MFIDYVYLKDSDFKEEIGEPNILIGNPPDMDLTRTSKH
jgi:hypothetical protein